MAQIDLKNATIRLKDGSTITGGTVNYDPPAAPALATATTGGTILAGTYGVRITYVTAAGETTQSGSTNQVTTGSTSTITVTSPVAKPGATLYKVYMTAAGPGATWHIQNGSGTAIGTNYVQTADPNVGGAQPPGTNTAAYPVSGTTINVAGLTVEVDNNTLFTNAGDTTEYRVTSHTPTSGATTTLVFTPAIVIKMDHADVLTFQPRRLEIKIGEGNLTWSEKKNIDYTMNRGNLDTVREGDKEPVDMKLDFTWEFIKASTGLTPTVEDVLKNKGEASHWVTSASDPCEPFAIDLEVEYVPPCGGIQREFILFPDFRYESLDHDLREGQVSVSGKANVTEPTVTRVT